MTTQTADTTVQTAITVDAPIERAFTVFTDGIGSWWTPEHHILQAPLAEMVFEPHVGGHIYDRGTDGSECRWARVLTYEPPNRIVFSWTSACSGSSSRIRARPARSRSASSPRAPPVRASSSNTGTFTTMARAGRKCATRSAPPTAGTWGSAAMPKSCHLSRPACRRQVEGRAITSRGEVQAAEQSRKA
jgi:uncharacterized protein YndB with AHSA1/START domain